MFDQDLKDSLGKIADREIIKSLAIKSNGLTLLYELSKIIEQATSLLKEIKNTFSDYTNHDIEHSESVIKRLDQLIPNVLKSKMNSYEIFFLLCSAVLHDLGMVDFTSELDTEFKYSDKEKNFIQYQNEIRERHHIRSEDYIQRYYKDLKISDIYQANIIGRICRGHRKENLNDIDQFRNAHMYKDYAINVQLLASLLRICDELDLTSGRAPIIVYEHVQPKDSISILHWNSHLSVSGIGPDPKFSYIIKGDAICKDSKIHRNLKNLENKINNELSRLPLYLHQYSKFKNDLPLKFELHVDNQGYEFLDLKFSLYDKNIVKILMGRRLYNREEECIREILKNSIDSIRYREELLKQRGDVILKPKIVVKESIDPKRYIINDNGIGMNRRIVKNYFTKIGKSFYTSTEFFKKNMDFKPVGELGIGILSAFMISKEIIINTKMEENESLILEIDDFTDYFIIKDSYKTSIGTSITLNIKQEYFDKINLKKELEYYLRHLDFPITFIDKNNKEIVLIDNGFRPNLKDFELWKKHNRTFEVLEFNTQDFRGKIGVLIKKVKDTYYTTKFKVNEWNFKRFAEKNKDLASNIETRMNFSYNGIFIGNLKNILPDYYNDYEIWIDIDFKTILFDLNIARNDIVRNEKFRNLQFLIENLLLSNLQGFLEKFDNVTQEFNNNFIQKMINLYILDKTAENDKINPNLLKFLYQFYSFKCIHNSKILWLNTNDFIKINSKIYRFNIDTGVYYGPSELEIRELLLNSPLYDVNSIYIIKNSSSSGFLKNKLSIELISYLSLFDYEKIKSKISFFPKTWSLCKFKRKKKNRFFEYVDYSKTLMNKDHRFIKILIEKKKIIDESSELSLALKGFFKDLKKELKNNFEKTIENQKLLLKNFVDKGLIDETNLQDLLLKEEDFPDKFFQQ